MRLDLDGVGSELGGSRLKLGGRGLWEKRPPPSQAKKIPVTIAKGKHPLPFRTRKLSPSAPMVLQGGPCGRVGRRWDLFLFLFLPERIMDN